MAQFVGKIDLGALMGVQIMEVETDTSTEKGIFIPFRPNDIVLWNNEYQLWFRAIAYRSPMSRFTHFLMKFIPRKDIKKLSAVQLEAFAKRKIGGLIKADTNETEQQQELDTNSFIQNNL